MLYSKLNAAVSEQQQTKRYRTALYLRLSREDGDKSESDSIANQRSLLESYAAEHTEFCIIDEFVDDGYSGSTFERPAFKRLFAELEAGTINCILVKDLSRFGRNYIEVGRYLEQIFPVMRVRLIAVTDHYDSAAAWQNHDSIMVPMRNLLNDAYCRDISVKIKSQLAVKRKRGDFVGSFASFGYRKDPQNHSRLLIDEEAASTIQDIFAWKIYGMGNQGIADKLNANNIPSPAVHKRKTGQALACNFSKRENPLWSAKAVDRILHNELYIGNLVQGKTRRLDYRSKHKVAVPEQDWARVECVHEAIIEPQQFELVQRILETETRRPNGQPVVALFAGFVYCADCGSRMVRRTSCYKDKKYSYYQCAGYKQDKNICSSHNFSADKLYTLVLNAVQHQIQLVTMETDFLATMENLQQESYRVKRIDGQIAQLRQEHGHTQRVKEKLYADYADEILSRSDYLAYSQTYQERLKMIEEKLQNLERERQKILSEPRAYTFLDAYRKYRNAAELTRPMVVELIERIEILDHNHANITFRFQDEILELLHEIQEQHDSETA